MFRLFRPSGTESVTLDQAQEAGALIVDIRSPTEWHETGVLPGAKLITFASVTAFLSALRPHLRPGQAVALICASGARTAQARALLAGKLDAPLFDIKGGMIAAIGAGAPVTFP